jgi:L-ascorbate metabolism protein UlaG (beta-lactamase superfamily)
VLSLHGHSIYLGGDSGYSDQFKLIGERYGPFDLALLDGAQYNDLWTRIHMTPEQTIQATADLKAKTLLPVHWGEFAMALHPWDEPIKRLMAASHNTGLQVVTPAIGEAYIVGEQRQFKPWWHGDEQ